MKVLMVHRNDGCSGGAQIQMNRLRCGLVGAGIDARVLCREGDPDHAVLMPSSPLAERWLGRISRRIGLNDIHLVSSYRVPAMAECAQSDILDIHCLHSGTFSYAALPALTAAKPTVFTFHDMWPLTGHCHANLGCGRWTTGCGQCPHLDVEPSVRRDATAIEWRLKRRAYARSRFAIVTPSRWLHDRVKLSMLGGKPVHHIPHGVDPELFKPLDKGYCREHLGIPQGKTVLLCVIDNMERPLKGGELLVETLRNLPDPLRQNSVLLFIGWSNPTVLKRIPMEVADLGYLCSDRLKVIAYSAADVLINPSRAESFGLVALESMACGTPVAAFAVGGIPELVRPGISGMLAEPDNPQDLANQIERMIQNRERLEEMGRHCRNIAVNEYSLALQVKRYAELYGSVIQGWADGSG